MNVPNYYQILNDAKAKKECYVGPFSGEYGHMLIHVLPFLGYLYKQDIKIHFCGHANQESLCVDNAGNPIVADYYGLPNWFSTGVPDMNNLNLISSDDVKTKIAFWIQKARDSSLPFFDLSDMSVYRYAWWPWWYQNRFGYLFNIGKTYNPERIIENSAAVFTRTKPRGTAQGTDQPDFDMNIIVDTVSNHVDTVYIVGHPDQAHEVTHPKAKNLITPNNIDIITAVSKCKVMLSHNSGAAYVGKMLRIPTIVFHNGDLSRFQWTDYCSRQLSKSPLLRAETYDQIDNIIKEILV